MIQICTTKEQSQRLLDLGIQRKTADMFWPLKSSFPEVCNDGDQYQADYPAWSLGSLINLLPDVIFAPNRTFRLEIRNRSISYVNGDSLFKIEENKGVFENCFSMIEWLVEHKYLKL